jgi:uncharacterized Zn finger protein
MAKRSVTRAGLAEWKWSVVLELVEKSRLRRGRAAARQGGVREVAVADRVVSALVKVGHGNAKVYRVAVPCVDWWANYADQVAAWLSRRTDWLASLHAKVWDPGLLEFVEQTGLTLFPRETDVEAWISGVRCPCLDWEPLCVHVAALVCHMVDEVQKSPLAAFRYVGLDVDEVLERAKLLSSALAREVMGATPADDRERLELSLAWTKEEISCLQGEEPREPTVAPGHNSPGYDSPGYNSPGHHSPGYRSPGHKVMPVLNRAEWQSWKDVYMAWE